VCQSNPSNSKEYIIMSMSTSLARALRALMVALTAVLGVGALAATSAEAKVKPKRAETKPTIVFVHGAFGDASGFAAVTGRLQRHWLHRDLPRRSAARASV
jgi:hypothetical protein